MCYNVDREHLAQEAETIPGAWPIPPGGDRSERAQCAGPSASDEGGPGGKCRNGPRFAPPAGVGPCQWARLARGFSRPFSIDPLDPLGLPGCRRHERGQPSRPRAIERCVRWGPSAHSAALRSIRGAQRLHQVTDGTSRYTRSSPSGNRWTIVACRTVIVMSGADLQIRPRTLWGQGRGKFSDAACGNRVVAARAATQKIWFSAKDCREAVLLAHGSFPRPRRSGSLEQRVRGTHSPSIGAIR